jgi:hypothetical protein
MMISFTKIKMAQIQPQNQYLNPFAYFANTPFSIEKRKKNAKRHSNMKIVDFTTNHQDNSFEVIIKGNRGITYNVFFSERAITCSCPDFQKHTVKPICKHMFKLICLSENHDIFNNSMLLTDLMNPQHLECILTSTLRIIDIKKMERFGGPQNPISIERDEYCPICYGDFDENISACSECKHVFHTQCIYLSWNSVAYSVRGKCPMCREINSFPYLRGGNNNNDPWEIYNFPSSPSFPSPLPHPPALPAPEPAPQVESNIHIGNPPFPFPAQQYDELIQENDDDFFLNHGFLPIQNNDNHIPEPELEIEPVLLLEDNIEGGPNENSDGVESTLPVGEILSNSHSLFEDEEYNIIDTRIKILNISLFILETINIIFNQIHYPQELPE